MPLMKEGKQGVSLVTSREPVGPGSEASPSTVGEQAFNDAVLIIIVCWVILFLFFFSLRRHNI